MAVDDVVAAGLTTDGGGALVVDFPGSGWATGLGLEDVGFYKLSGTNNWTKGMNPTFEGPPALRSLPWVIGLTTPGFRLAGGRDTLSGGSPVATRTV